VAEFLKQLGCRSIREPTVVPGAEASGALPRSLGWEQGDGSSRGASSEAREAGIVLDDPKASPRSGRGGSRR